MCPQFLRLAFQMECLFLLESRCAIQLNCLNHILRRISHKNCVRIEAFERYDKRDALKRLLLIGCLKCEFENKTQYDICCLPNLSMMARSTVKPTVHAFKLMADDRPCSPPFSLLYFTHGFESILVQWCNPLTLQPEQSGGVGSKPGRAPPLERHDMWLRT